MNREKILREIRILKSQNEATANALTVLEKEFSGSGMPENSARKGSKKAKLDAIRDQARINIRKNIKKAAGSGS